MKKQTLFATGATNLAEGNHVVLTPDDKPALALTTQVSKSQSPEGRYNGRDAFKVRLRANGLSYYDKEKVAKLLQKIMPHQIMGWEDGSNDYFYVYSDRTYQFLVTDNLALCQELYGKIAALPPAVDADEDQATDGLTESVGPANYTPVIQYHVPFDHAAWQARHRQNAEIQTIDAQADADRAEADRLAALADQARQKARLLLVARIATIAAVILLVVILLAVILKKK